MTGGWSDLQSPSGATTPPESAALSVAIIEDQKASGTHGGGFTTGADRTRDLTTVVSDPDGIVSLSANQFGLQEGTYLIRWSCPAFQVGNHQSMLYNASSGTVIKRGGSAYALSGSFGFSQSDGSHVVDVVAETLFEIRHACATTWATTGFGAAAGLGTEVYTRVEILKVG